jgi:hypothetical protein
LADTMVKLTDGDGAGARDARRPGRRDKIGAAPDCEITMNSAWCSIKGARNAVSTEEALAETGR